MAAHSSILAWKIPQTEDPRQATEELNRTAHTRAHTHTYPFQKRENSLSVKTSYLLYAKENNG